MTRRHSRITDRDRAALRRIMAPARRAKPALYSRTCVICGGDFTAKRPEAQTCSDRCRREKHVRGQALPSRPATTAANG